MKQCKLCEQFKDEGQFAENTALPDRLQAACRECIKKQQESFVVHQKTTPLKTIIGCCGR